MVDELLDGVEEEAQEDGLEVKEEVGMWQESKNGDKDQK